MPCEDRPRLGCGQEPRNTCRPHQLQEAGKLLPRSTDGERPNAHPFQLPAGGESLPRPRDTQVQREAGSFRAACGWGRGHLSPGWEAASGTSGTRTGILGGQGHLGTWGTFLVVTMTGIICVGAGRYLPAVYRTDVLTHGRPSVLCDSERPSAHSCYKCSEPREAPSVPHTDPQYFLHGFNKHQSFQEHNHHVHRKKAGLFLSQMLLGAVHRFLKVTCPPCTDGTPVLARAALRFLTMPHRGGSR